MKEEDKILDSMQKNNKSNALRNSCFIITALAVVILVVFAYVASKEVSNAFQIVDKGLINTNESFEKSNETLKNALLKTKEYQLIVEEIDSISSNFNTLIDSTINQLMAQTGGRIKGTKNNELTNPQNYEIPTRILISEKVGEKIEQSIKQTNLSYNRILRHKLGVDTIDIPLKLNYEFQKKNNKTWPEMNFDHLPLMAVMPLLSKFKNDEKKSRANMYNFMANK